MDPARMPRVPRAPIVGRALRRLASAYFVRDLNAGSFFLASGGVLLVGGVIAALVLRRHAAAGAITGAASVAACAVAVLAGLQLLIAAVQHEVASVPRRPLHAHLVKRKEADLSATGWVRPGG